MIDLPDLLSTYERIALTGAVGSGKTTLSEQVTDRPVIHTDDYISHGWDNLPGAIQAELDDLGPYFLEGIQVPRVIRRMDPTDPAFPQVLVVLTSPHRSLTLKQAHLSRQVNDWALALRKVLPVSFLA